MSRFSVYLKNLVEESGVPHATLARAAGLNRPNLQNILSGSRKPSQKDVESLLPHLRASAAQQTELMELLEEELLGPDVVERRACVRTMLERLDQSFQATPVPRQVWPAAPGSTNGMELISGDAAILNMLASLLSEGNLLGGKLVFFPGFPKHWLQRSLSILCGLHGEGLQIVQLVEFWKAPQAEAAAANLNALSDALPMLLSSRLDYELWYTYAAHVELPHAGVLFPCCLLLPQAVVLLHRDGQQAMIFRDPAALRCWQEGAQAMLAEAKPLFNRNMDTLSILNYYNEVDTQSHRSGFIQFQPCLVPYADEKILDRLLLPQVPGRDDLIQAILTYGELLRQQSYTGIFYEEGLRLFAQTGFIYDLPQNGSVPAPPDIRKTVLERLYQDCAKGERVMRIAKPQRLRLPQNVMVAVREYVGVHFVLPLEHSGDYCNVQVAEATITEAFLDFIAALACSDATCSKEKTLEIIRREIEESNL